MSDVRSAEKRVNMAAPDDLAIRACRLLVEDGPECECGRLEVCFRCAAQAALQPAPARPSKLERVAAWLRNTQDGEVSYERAFLEIESICNE